VVHTGGGLVTATAEPSGSERGAETAAVTHPIFKDKTECITICMPGSSSIHIVTSSVNNQQQYHEKRIQKTKNYQSYTAYPGNEDSKLHRQLTGGCVGLELSIIFKRLHITFSSE
jgi:hypothetical protein